jgi:hypothetical protein
MPYLVFSTYEDTRVDWLFEADSLEDARRKVTDDTLDDVISDKKTRCIGSATVEARELCTDSGDPGERADIQEIDPYKETWAVRDIEKEMIEDARKKPLPDNWPVDANLTLFDEFEIQPVRQHRDCQARSTSTANPATRDEEATFWTVYGHYDPDLPENAFAGRGGVNALVDCWSRAGAEMLARMLDRFRQMQTAVAALIRIEAAG